MASVNRVTLIGNLGRDPELRYTAGGQPVASFSVATNERWNDREGKTQERTEWHRIVVWGKLAEFCEKYLTKGRQILVEGRLRTRDWQDRDGNKRRTTEVEALNIVFLGRREESSATSDTRDLDQDYGRAGGRDDAAGGEDAAPFDDGPGSSGGTDDDIPF
jgi:single-strand DNA-binding protein